MIANSLGCADILFDIRGLYREPGGKGNFEQVYLAN